jgi:hypothetical protein
VTEITFREVPFVEDEQLKRFIHQVGKLRTLLVLQTVAILKQSPPGARLAPAIVTIGLLQRLAEVSGSIELLSSKGRGRDCAVLLVTVMELRLDLQYISADRTRAEAWLSHTQQHRKPWAVSRQLKDLFPVQEEFEAEQDNYRRLSMAKHGNPVAGLESFPLGLHRSALLLPKDSIAIPYLCSLLYCLGMNLTQSMRAAFHLLKDEGFQVDDIEVETEAQVDQLQSLIKSQIMNLIAAWRSASFSESETSSAESEP